jgi:hypothetical protein
MNGSGSFDCAAANHAGVARQYASSSRSAMPPRWAWSPEIWVMVRPAAAYRYLAGAEGHPADDARWSALRRPMFVAFVLGCMVSLVTSQRLTLRHVADGTINASLILLGQIAALAVLRGRERTLSFSRAIDLYFMGYGPWLLWILGFSAAWSFASPVQAFASGGMRTILPAACVAAIWSGYIDFCFFERVLQRSAARAAWDLMRLGVISWSVSIVIFGGGPLWSEHMRMLGR